MVKVLFVICGSVAIVKVAEVVRLLKESINAEVKIVATNKAIQFLQYPHNLVFEEPLITDAEEQKWIRKGDPILHIELRKWADVAVLLPLSANSLAKLTNGVADNLATAIMRAWPFKDGVISKPAIAFPTMNTCMWEQPITKIQLDILRQYGYVVVEPVNKLLACGEEGMGALPDVEACVEEIIQLVSATSAPQ